MFTNMTAHDHDEILVRALSTPNPLAYKFVTNRSLKTDGKATFSKADSDLPLVRSLFEIEGVEQVYLFQNSVTVTHSGTLSEEDLRDQVVSVIRSRLSIHDPDFVLPDERKPRAQRSSDPQIIAIEEILDRTVRPGLQADGGDLEILSYEDNILRINYQGACGSCPSSLMGTLDAITSILRAEFDPGISVEAAELGSSL